MYIHIYMHVCVYVCHIHLKGVPRKDLFFFLYKEDGDLYERHWKCNAYLQVYDVIETTEKAFLNYGNCIEEEDDGIDPADLSMRQATAREAHLSPFLNCDANMTIIEMRVHMDCHGCEKRIRKALQNLEGVDDIIIDMSMQKVTVMGWAEQKKVLKTVRQNGRAAELWPYPFNPEYHSFIYHYHHQLKLNSPQSTEPDVTYNALSSSSSSHKHKKHEYSGSGDGLTADYGCYQQAPFTTLIDEEVGAMFSDENPHACSIM